MALTPFARPNIPEILKIRLVEIEITWDGIFRRVDIYRADDLYQCYNRDRPLPSLIPYSGEITRAVIAVHLADPSRVVTLELYTSQAPVLPTGSDTAFLKRWLTQSGFCE